MKRLPLPRYISVSQAAAYASYPRWMKLKEAAWYSKIGQKRLVQLAQDGHIKGFQDPDSKRGDWVFCRLSIDDYRENQAGSDYEKAVAIMGNSVV